MCMSALFETGGRELILITLGAPYSYVTPFNLKDTITIKEYLDKNYSDEVIFEEGKTLVQIPVVGSKEESYEIKVPSTVRAYVEKERSESDATFEFDGVATLSYKFVKAHAVELSVAFVIVVTCVFIRRKKKKRRRKKRRVVTR